MSSHPTTSRAPGEARSTATDSGTADRILDSAETLVQTRGFNGFSYAHIAAELGITKASLHYHFPSKAKLGEALIDRYAERFLAALARIDAAPLRGRDKLDAYAALYAGVIRLERMCLCGILAAEYLTLPPPMSAAILAFFDANEAWLTAVLLEGLGDGSVRFDGDPQTTARSILGGLEGAMLVARPYADPARFESAAARLLAALDGERAPLAARG